MELIRNVVSRIRTTKIGLLFLNKSFFHYFWTGGLFTLLNIFLVWLCIDVFNIPTIISSSAVIGGLFIARFVVYRWLKVL